MKTYKIEIEEILQDVVEVKAKSLKDAINIVKEKYYSGEYVLDSEAIKEINIKEYIETLFNEKAKKKELER